MIVCNIRRSSNAASELRHNILSWRFLLVRVAVPAYRLSAKPDRASSFLLTWKKTTVYTRVIFQVHQIRHSSTRWSYKRLHGNRWRKSNKCGNHSLLSEPEDIQVLEPYCSGNRAVTFYTRSSAVAETARSFVFVCSQLQHTYRLQCGFSLLLTAASDLLVYKILLWLLNWFTVSAITTLSGKLLHISWFAKLIYVKLNWKKLVTLLLTNLTEGDINTLIFCYNSRMLHCYMPCVVQDCKRWLRNHGATTNAEIAYYTDSIRALFLSASSPAYGQELLSYVTTSTLYQVLSGYHPPRDKSHGSNDLMEKSWPQRTNPKASTSHWRTCSSGRKRQWMQWCSCCTGWQRRTTQR